MFQSGLYYGYLGLVDGILERLVAELGPGTKVVATGGFGALIGTESRFITAVDDLRKVKGIGAKTLEKVRPFAKVGDR